MLTQTKTYRLNAVNNQLQNKSRQITTELGRHSYKECLRSTCN